ncbi:hypothetical protein IEQ34_010448 [Dendrobium chrysotoxum]|uniref:SWIRM domain-containing protein n=1 Tax=Dendrobium chrysotoxum TaxID=161865 RepID=A0AAV7GX33_DENCH|nr:hypothetical protein IEQ34_010448 [Dendrobium chrysotoxum]
MNTPPPAAERRRSRRASALKTRTYDESALDGLFEDHLESSRKRNRTLEERQKETKTEAMIALSLGFPIDALLDSELAAGVLSSPGEQNDYVVVRNHILARWRANVRSWLFKSQIRETVHSDYDHLISAAYDFLSEQGYINFGVSHAIHSHFPDVHECGSVIIVGAGLAGLAAARQLLGFGFKVLVLEGRDRPGGRVYTSKIGTIGNFAVVDLGGSVITGIHANPLGVLARQLGIPLHKIRDSCPLYSPNGRVVDEKLDTEVNSVFNKLLEKATEARKALGESGEGISLGSAIEKLRKLYSVARSEDERELLDWHLANLEYANAGCLSDLSLAHWDQDDPFEMDGDHCFLAGGNWRLINALCEDVPILYRKTVTRIQYGDSGVEMVVAGGQVFRADMVLCTVPLGVLKNESIKFDPELPSQKLGAINRLGFGLLNKVAMLFPYVFWGEELDTFGCLNKDREKRGEFFLFYCYHTVSGGALLTALVAGKAALTFELTDPVALLHNVLGVLRGIYRPRGIEVPDPIQTICTKWGGDPLCHGSYSHIRVGSSGRDYDILAESVSGSLFFAGEATNRHYPATMHGAFLSGLREASRILHTWQSRKSDKNEPKKPLQKSLRFCSDILTDLFREPDLAFGNFLFISDPSTADDPKATGLMSIEFGKNVNQDTVQSLQLSDRCNQPLHLYVILSREQALQVQLVNGDFRSKLSLICNKFGLKLMGYNSTCTLFSSLIIEISRARKSRNKLCRFMRHITN